MPDLDIIIDKRWVAAPFEHVLHVWEQSQLVPVRKDHDVGAGDLLLIATRTDHVLRSVAQTLPGEAASITAVAETLRSPRRYNFVPARFIHIKGTPKHRRAGGPAITSLTPEETLEQLEVAAPESAMVRALAGKRFELAARAVVAGMISRSPRLQRLWNRDVSLASADPWIRPSERRGEPFAERFVRPTRADAEAAEPHPSHVILPGDASTRDLCAFVQTHVAEPVAWAERIAFAAPEGLNHIRVERRAEPPRRWEQEIERAGSPNDVLDLLAAVKAARAVAADGQTLARELQAIIDGSAQ